MQNGRTMGETLRYREAAGDPDGDDIQPWQDLGQDCAAQRGYGAWAADVHSSERMQRSCAFPPSPAAR